MPTLAAGPRDARLRRFPYGIKQVDYSVDGGKTWQPATLVPPTDLEYAWVRFEFPWEATPGKHVLMTRATDKKGEAQPDTVRSTSSGSTATSCRASRSRCCSPTDMRHARLAVLIAAGLGAGLGRPQFWRKTRSVRWSKEGDLRPPLRQVSWR